MHCRFAATIPCVFALGFLDSFARTQTQTVPVPTAGLEHRVVNAPVAPEAIYIGRKGGLSVIDLNGFGQGTGSIARYLSPNYPYGYKRNPNVGQPGIVPMLGPSTSNRDAGSSGALTLTLDSSLSDVLAHVSDASDVQVGQPLDLVYNNEGINKWALTILQVNPWSEVAMPGNSIAVAPHPNPPRLVEPAPNPRMGIECEEPTVTTSIKVAGRVTTMSPPCTSSPLNKLVNGNPFSQSLATLGVFHQNFYGVFHGPQPMPPSPPPPTPYCPYTTRQQIGHFLYVLDTSHDAIAVLNSNRMTRLTSIPLPSPSAIAIAPHLGVLAVTNERHGTVSFIDSNPLSPTFHRVLGSIHVGSGPTKLAWQPEGEALVVCNTSTNTLSIIDGSSFTVRSLSLPTNAPIDVAVSSRQFRIGIDTWTWFAYVLHKDGALSLYESGPTPIGPDRVTTTGLKFTSATRLHHAASLAPTCFVAHQDANGLGQISVVETKRTTSGGRTSTVTVRIGGSNSTTPIKDRLSGNRIVDIAFDDMKNFGAHPEFTSPLYPSLPHALHSGKSLARRDGTKYRATYEPRFVFVALDDSNTVDIVELATGKLFRSLSVPGVRSLGHYFSQ
ncbi:MAG: YncE family protein [Planctomycetes bacterium]|nr:YncE family protein [Planctomycetota bacterium]